MKINANEKGDREELPPTLIMTIVPVPTTNVTLATTQEKARTRNVTFHSSVLVRAAGGEEGYSL